ncbi:efflux RND transporter periplasmic adaptor subunit [Stieleria sp. JC731]|uniref:efflux RND transporter periplasmic adaptor subunit n=1 Tax=Pirellulaceae TaxID=2691357 RepID=UPI001E2D8935|nr:efflux RND transporter periplasmic adaptor subunit [Stieleria sp. JC731]MCC9603306.1 efflux RND transporter periplasmic adaptor subunit [Stieleria sp. JC731]
MHLKRELICLGVLATTLAMMPRQALAQGGPALVELSPVVSREVASGQSFVGTVTPTRRAVVGSAVDGRVIDVFFEEGDRVEKDQPLAQLLTQTISLELAAAQAELDLRREQLKEMENGSLPEEINQARARLSRAKVTAQFSQRELERLAVLSQKNATSQSEYDSANSSAQEAQEAYDEAKASLQLALDGPRPERIAQAKAQVAMQEAVVNKLQDQIKKYTIYTRFAGYITVKHTDIGAWATQGGAIAEVIALDEVDVVAKVVDSQVSFINVGDSVRVEVPAVPGHTFTGRVAFIVPQADVRSRTFPVKIRVKNVIAESNEPMLKAGMLTRVTLATGSKTQAMLVPKDALVLGGAQTVVWIVDPASITKTDTGQQAEARLVPVTLGVSDDDLIQVIGNVPSGSYVVSKGNERIIPNRSGEPSLVNLVPNSVQPSADSVSQKGAANVAD